jgi:hypothetical protein
MPNPLVRQIVRSLKSEPHRWECDGRTMFRDDGVEIALQRQFDGKLIRPKMMKPRYVEFSFLESLFLRRAIRKWARRPLII